MLVQIKKTAEFLKEKTNFTTGVNYEIFNPLLVGLAPSTTLSEYLTNYSNIYIKEYGALATPAFRGTSSLAVLWTKLI